MDFLGYCVFSQPRKFPSGCAVYCIRFLHAYVSGVFQYIQEMREILHNLQNRILQAKQNMEGITQVMEVSERQSAGQGSVQA